MSYTSWNYRPVNSARYPGVSRLDTFITEPPRTLGTPRNSATPRGLHHRKGTPLCPEDEKELVARLSRPTLSSRLRFDAPQLSFSYVNRPQTWDAHYEWHKMDFLRDSYKCIWSRHGTIKKSFTL